MICIKKILADYITLLKYHFRLIQELNIGFGEREIKNFIIGSNFEFKGGYF
jgi:hypothetical protein